MDEKKIESILKDHNKTKILVFRPSGGKETRLLFDGNRAVSHSCPHNTYECDRDDDVNEKAARSNNDNDFQSALFMI